MIKSGLVSITFRKLSVDDVVDLVKQAGIDAIEWGGDIHVPHGNIEKACEVRKLCKSHNIATPSYGSYYRAGISENESLSFSSVLETGKALGVDTIRVWAGNQPSETISCESRKKTVADLHRIATIAEKENISISLEYHAKTLTDSTISSKQLMDELNHKNIYFYWQPPNGMSEDLCMESLKTVMARLSNLHVFYWEKDEEGKVIKLPLKNGVKRWTKYINLVNKNRTKEDMYALIEFVEDGKPEQFLKDAKILKELLNT